MPSALRSLSRPWFVLPILALCAAMAVLGWWIGHRAADEEVTARPALWRVFQGDREAYLFGTIHAVPQGERWLSPVITRAISHSDVLILEVIGLEGERRTRATFERLGRTPDLPPIAARLKNDADTRLLAELERRHPAELRNLDRYDSWAAALLVNAAASSGLSLSTENAGEAVFSHMFGAAGKPIEGLETIAGQLGLFDTLSKGDQNLLLTQAVREAGDAPRLYSLLHDAWAKGDLITLERQFLAPLTSTPMLKQILVDARNRRWSLLIDRRLRTQSAVPFIAVGAGHLVGAQSVQARLAAMGWRIERVQ